MTVLSRPAEGVVYAYDRSDRADPRIVAAFPVGGTPDGETVSADLTRCVYATGEQVVCVDQAGDVRWRLALGARGPRAGVARTACVLAGDDVWVYVPDALAGRGGHDRWLRVSAATGAVLADRALDCAGHGAFQYVHPVSGEVLLEVGEGQDGSRAYRSSGGGFDWHDRVLVGIAPDGTEFLTMAHDGDDVAVHRWPDGSVRVRAHVGEVLHVSGYLDADTAIVVAGDDDDWRHVTVDTRTGAVTGELRVVTVDPYDLQALGDGSFVTTDTDGRLRGHVPVI